MYPKELQEAVDKYCDEFGDSIDLSSVQANDGTKKFVFLDKYFVLPNNTAGSDDYHSWQIVVCFNMNEIFKVNFKKTLAQAKIYEKNDSTQPGYCQEDDLAKVISW